ncbi:hypothetical protein C9374_013322 [Naegleria lovaniensis]|uniref:Uncharacterized protein n=1 Tax=Naegleria lovaniensis TaxID=51637 RepID=A0AA88KQ19_NAELO|nr:uncharacterized protein C9374_013322 [Naegleria lovaniensis]KAG2391837.1 hypothetical protein C9374_013322 [Naegleria lovaniensis]
MPQKAPSLNSVVEVIVVDDSQTPTTPANQNNNFNANHDNTNVEKLLDPSVLELSLEKVIDLETGDDPTHKKFMDKSNENILTENQQEKSSPGITTRRISTPSIIPDETIEVTNSQEHGAHIHLANH